MVTSVNTNVNALAAVHALSDISNQLTQTQGAIESGLKVGSAADNPAVFTIAQGLRANVNALTAVSDTLNTGIATLQGQTAGATSISTALNTLKITVTQSEGQTGDALAASQATIKNALANIDAYAKASTINGGLGLTRFGGHPEAFTRGVYHAQKPPSLFTRVPASNGRSGACRTISG